MDRAMIAEHLAQAERHVAEGEKIISRQRALVVIAEATGGDAERSKALLASFEDTQAIHIADRERLREELRNADRT
jgi:hypothetical protein